MARNPQFREDASRSILISGEINEDLVHRLTSPVAKLKGDSRLPITAYLNSRGGFTESAEHILSLLKSPNQEGEVCRLITVATTRADSAAANLLALGDYAIAYPTATIHCHGTRVQHSELTKERADLLAASLKRRNDEFALRLARRAFSRIAFHFPNLRSEFDAIRQEADREKWGADMSTDLACFSCAIFRRLSPELSSKNLTGQVHTEFDRLEKIKESVLAKLGEVPADQSWTVTESNILKSLIDYELEENDGNDDWTLGAGGFDQLSRDFLSLSDYLFGPHRKSLEDHLKSVGVLFLRPEQIVEYQDLLGGNREDADKWLEKQAKPVVEQMWFFVVSLCRLLQSGEWSLTATDAYWLGIVDEVIGEKLPTLRLIAEHPEA